MLDIETLELKLEEYTTKYQNEDLLEAAPEIQEEGAKLLYQIGKGYYQQEDFETAADYFETGLSFDLDTTQDYVVDMVEAYGYALLNSGQTEKAIILESVYEEFDSDCDFVFLMGLVYMANDEYDKAVVEFEKATTFADAKIEGANTYLANYNAGIICECQKQTEEALSYYKKCGNYDKALTRIMELTK